MERLRAEAARRELEACRRARPTPTIASRGPCRRRAGQDRAEMPRMYVRWAEARTTRSSGSRERGEEAGLKSATVAIRGPDAYGWLKTERRSSPRPHLTLRFERAAPYGFASVRSTWSSTTRSRSRSTTGSAHRHLSLLGCRRAARQQTDSAGASPICERHRRSARASARSTEPRLPSRCCAPGEAECKRREA